MGLRFAMVCASNAVGVFFLLLLFVPLFLFPFSFFFFFLSFAHRRAPYVWVWAVLESRIGPWRRTGC